MTTAWPPVITGIAALPSAACTHTDEPESVPNWLLLARLDLSGPCAPSPLSLVSQGGEPVTDLAIGGFARASAPGSDAAPGHVVVADTGLIPCIYCREPIPAAQFAYWSAAKPLLSASCPGCSRRTTLQAATWHRWCELAGRSEP